MTNMENAINWSKKTKLSFMRIIFQYYRNTHLAN